MSRSDFHPDVVLKEENVQNVRFMAKITDSPYWKGAQLFKFQLPFHIGRIKMSGRGRRNIPVDESNPDSNASIAQLLRLLVEQSSRGNGQSSSSRGPSHDDPQERFRRQKPREFSGTTVPFVAESWIKSMEVIFEYLQIPDLEREHCDVSSMQMDSDLVIYRTTLVRTFQVVIICRVDKSEVLVVLISPHYSKRKWVCLVTLVMSLFDLQDVCIVIGTLATLDLPMVVDLIGIYVLKGPYCTLTMTNWFLQTLSVIPRGSWRDVARRFTMIRWASPKLWFRSHNGCGPTDICIPEPLKVTQVLDWKFPHGN
ncbi:hypothetical protein F511_08598 [Dorcoceras hygrometricum]|uniref:Uncharacterized protein n=1 Tax=Dorcoceras hygrometricum TaxID=472368 RepID=A0A2Z7BN53_9LAMI|nr:hypothetical protein F511_08598 [Dorcoceras hygrometricum]